MKIRFGGGEVKLALEVRADVFCYFAAAAAAILSFVPGSFQIKIGKDYEQLKKAASGL